MAASSGRLVFCREPVVFDFGETGLFWLMKYPTHSPSNSGALHPEGRGSDSPPPNTPAAEPLSRHVRR